MLCPKYCSIITSALCIVFGSCAAGQCPSPDQALDDSLCYRHGHATLLAPPAKKLPFFLIVDNEGTGYFSALGTPKGLAPNGVPSDWSAKTKTLKSDISWARLPMSTAKNVWGEPHHAPERPGDIFDAIGHFNGETNIYHLDLTFDKFDQLTGYRVRGIGISHPRVISLQSDGTPFITPEF